MRVAFREPAPRLHRSRELLLLGPSASLTFDFVKTGTTDAQTRPFLKESIKVTASLTIALGIGIFQRRQSLFRFPALRTMLFELAGQRWRQAGWFAF